MLAVIAVVALPLATRPTSNPVDPGTNGLLAAASTAPSIGPHGDDTSSATGAPADLGAEPATDPPIERSVAPTGPRDPSELTGYRWPIRNARITNGFGKGYPGGFVIDGVTAHDGIDVANWCGAPIWAAHDGTVLSAGRHHEGYVGWLGNLTAYRAKLDAANSWRTRAIAIVIDDGNGYRSMYVHLAKVNVKAGDVVQAGDLIGWEGATGNATGCHLHYGLFSPAETSSWLLDPETQQRNLLPATEIARIDPFKVLPPLADAGITWAWGVTPED
ncbi:MAG TPA: M23 family metallopeptidase [Candidatus Limnocylindrales bacterium]|nr:M23 family metallopeptidase [Candidatus Limnocylindrales bacterium]